MNRLTVVIGATLLLPLVVSIIGACAANAALAPSLPLKERTGEKVVIRVENSNTAYQCVEVDYRGYEKYVLIDCHKIQGD